MVLCLQHETLKKCRLTGNFLFLEFRPSKKNYKKEKEKERERELPKGVGVNVVFLLFTAVVWDVQSQRSAVL